ncbi:hypothetical protein N7491_000670 [Penicillium cf. griseofulvum]|uniref:Uncharacterized protein n=1 Tax=Penicillium cf. griseofulvum TaxID=2972120 RepID=A0A9W9IM71_9EURO|nr:hypothetical protein N7472_011075 [Penicillium cf. griseofulvum]KAJ5442833.1 hypothetical protein N7445_004584 [Penicillium cf. griseofulvum]KAJ5451488.1 hypothetical protein N7491_000670 [Penicillium cf. griseofulvum]
MDIYAADATIRANLQKWFGIKEDPVTKQSLTTLECRITELIRHSSALKNGAGEPDGYTNPRLERRLGNF